VPSGALVYFWFTGAGRDIHASLCSEVFPAK
jgi:hypothetical protein